MERMFRLVLQNDEYRRIASKRLIPTTFKYVCKLLFALSTYPSQVLIANATS